MRPQRRHVLTAGLLGGAAAGVLVLAPQLTSAAEPAADVRPQAPPSTEPGDDATGDGDGDADEEATEDGEFAGRDGHLRDVLEPLVEEGTISDDQLDSVIDALRSAAPLEVWLGGPMIMHGPPGLPGRIGPGDFGFPPVPGFPGDAEIFVEGPGITSAVRLPLGPFTLDVIANAIGIDVSDLLTQLSDGSTVADVASDNGVAPDTVIDAVLEDVQERLDAAVTSGRMTQDQADERLANTRERITAWINGNDAGDEESGSTETTETTVTSA